MWTSVWCVSGREFLFLRTWAPVRCFLAGFFVAVKVMSLSRFSFKPCLDVFPVEWAQPGVFKMRRSSSYLGSLKSLLVL